MTIVRVWYYTVKGLLYANVRWLLDYLSLKGYYAF